VGASRNEGETLLARRAHAISAGCVAGIRDLPTRLPTEYECAGGAPGSFDKVPIDRVAQRGQTVPLDPTPPAVFRGIVMNEKVVLVAEDDLSHVALIRRAVAQSGVPCRLDVVRDGAEAIEYLFATGNQTHRDPRDPPDLILLDLKMPRMNGLQVLQVLRRVRGHEQRRYSPVVVLTGSENDHDIAEAYRLGAQSYICKPLDYSAFASTIRETLEYWLGLNRPIPRRYVAVASD